MKFRLPEDLLYTERTLTGIAARIEKAYGEFTVNPQHIAKRRVGVNLRWTITVTWKT